MSRLSQIHPLLLGNYSVAMFPRSLSFTLGRVASGCAGRTVPCSAVACPTELQALWALAGSCRAGCVSGEDPR